MRRDNPKNVGGVYAIVNKINGKRYIGSSIHLSTRFADHKRKLMKNRHTNHHLQCAWNKYGESNFDFVILENTGHKDAIEITKLEQTYLDSFHPAYNILPFARVGHGRKHTEETKQKMREHHADFRGEKNPMFGKHYHIFGRHCSEDTKRKIGLKSIGRTSKSVRVYNLNGSLLFDAKTMNEVITRLRPIDVHQIRRVLRGELSQYKGYKFEFLPR